MHVDRTRKLNSKQYTSGPIVYWMNREMRIHDNWALVYAKQQAQKYNTHIIVVYNLVTSFLGGGSRQCQFKLGGLHELIDTTSKYGIPFFVTVDTNGGDTPKQILEFVKKHKAGMLVTDFSPLKISRGWVATIRKTIDIPFIGVDAHNIVPVWTASVKQEFGAYTIRPKLFKLLPTFLDQFPKIQKQSPDILSIYHVTTHHDLDAIQKHITDPKPLSWIIPGEKAAHAKTREFITKKLTSYAHKRNDPTIDAQSDLSPYLHYGMIAPQRVVLEVLKHDDKLIEDIIDIRKNKAKIDPQKQLTDSDHAGAFLEELIVRRELSDNFCFYNENYDSVLGFPDWAKKSLEKSRTDTREYLYTKKQFENARTHDPLWNAAQNEMLATGKMHGYMRMYWAKKILEWTKTPEEALRIAIYLNDTYELDGRDPNGYAGIAWSIGGLHDRAWFERPVFGQIRYMNANGCKTKFDTKAYIEKWNK